MGSEFSDDVTGGDGVITIELSWPDKRLSPNSRVHRQLVAREKSLQRNVAKLRAWEQGYKKLVNVEGSYEIEYIFHPPDRRKRDIDNCLSMMKAAQDGVCDFLEVDDYRIKRTVLEWGEVVKGGKVVLRLEEMDEDN